MEREPLPALQGASVALPKPTRHWILFEHMLFVPFCIFGLWRPLVGIAFIFALMGLFFSRDTESLPGPIQRRAQLKKGLFAFYTAALLSSLALLLWPLDSNWRPISKSEGWFDISIALTADSSLAVVGVVDREILLQTFSPQKNEWTNLFYTGGNAWHIEATKDAIWIVPHQEARIYVYRDNTWNSFARPGGYCDSFAVTDEHIWLAIGGLYRGDVEDVSLNKIKEVPNARYVAASGAHISVGDYKGWYNSDDFGETWREGKPSVEGSAEPFVSADGRRYWIVNNFFSASMYVEAPGQAMMERELPVGDPRVIVINPNDSKELWLASWEGGVHRSLDAGVSWMDMGLHRVQIRSMAVDFTNKLVFAASSNLLFDKHIFSRSY